jgi:hypothetical protein
LEYDYQLYELAIKLYERDFAEMQAADPLFFSVASHYVNAQTKQATRCEQDNTAKFQTCL